MFLGSLDVASHSFLYQASTAQAQKAEMAARNLKMAYVRPNLIAVVLNLILHPGEITTEVGRREQISCQ